ncbi:MAG TPA: hypothetical protein VFU07_05075 [Candidatus Lumbricidophila sp.]|nr:hypothetical protein [Candidatus Lumbricidophila sp.]
MSESKPMPLALKVTLLVLGGFVLPLTLIFVITSILPPVPPTQAEQDCAAKHGTMQQVVVGHHTVMTRIGNSWYPMPYPDYEKQCVTK